MSFIYHISDSHKSFTFKRKIYHTPCVVNVITLSENKILRAALVKSGIKNVKVVHNKKQIKLSKVVPLNMGDGTVKLGSSIRN